MNRMVDTRGMACPLPVIEAKRAVEECGGNGVAEILADNELAVQNILKMTNQKNLTAVSERVGSEKFLIRIFCGTADAAETEMRAEAYGIGKSSKKGGTNNGGENGDGKNIVQNKNTAAGTGSSGLPCVVVISSDRMGGGDEKLGGLLMKAFLFALTGQDKLPHTILLYNRGAFISSEGSESLEDLRNLEAEGVEILTCGTCLDFYGLKEKLAVGGISNMYEIVEKQMQAGKIIKP